MANQSNSIYLSASRLPTYYQKLFPYLQLESSPKLSEADVKAGFFTVPESVKKHDFFKQLAKSIDSDKPMMQKRAEMQQCAVKFINENKDYVRDLSQLDARLKSLIYLFDEDKENLRGSHESIRFHFNSWSECQNFIKSDAFKSAQNRLWLSLLALLIELDYQLPWLEQLMLLLSNTYSLTLVLPTLPNLEEHWHKATEDSRYHVPLENWKSVIGDERYHNPEQNRHDASDESRNHTPQRLSGAEFLSRRRPHLLLPEEIFPMPCYPAQDSRSETVADLHHVSPYALGTLHMVEYQLIGYEPGELYKVETVLRGETRETTDRQLNRQIDCRQSTEISDEEKEKQLSQSNKDLTSIVQSVLAERQVENKFIDYKTDYLPTSPNATTNGSWIVSEAPSGGERKDCAEFTKDILNQTLDRATRQVSKARQSLLLTEREVTAVNSFSNSGEHNINGFYYWLNKKYGVTAIESQKRLLIEIVLPMPDLELREVLLAQGKLDIHPPQTLSELGVKGFHDILPEPTADTGSEEIDGTGPAPQIPNSRYYLDLCQAYELDEADTPPQAKIIQSASAQSCSPSCELTFDAPHGYQIEQIKISVQVDSDIENLSLMLGGQSHKIGSERQTLTLTNKPDENPNSERLPQGLGEQLSVSLFASYKRSSLEGDVKETICQPPHIDCSYLVNVKIVYSRTEQMLHHWQYRVWQTLNHAYQKKLSQYQAKLAEHTQWLEQHDNTVTLALIHRHIVKSAMHALYGNAMKRLDGDVSESRDGKNGLSNSDSPKDEMPYNQYADQALDWSRLYCKLSKKANTGHTSEALLKTHPALAQLDSTLYLKRYLTADKAKVLVPVKRGQEISFLYYLRMGQIWHGAESLAPVHIGDSAIVNDFTKLNQMSEDKRIRIEDVILPTTMYVLADDEELHHIGQHLDT